MLSGLLIALITLALVACVYLIVKSLRTVSMSRFERRLSKLEQQFADHDAAHARMSRSIDNLHRRLDTIVDQIVDRLSRVQE